MRCSARCRRRDVAVSAPCKRAMHALVVLGASIALACVLDASHAHGERGLQSVHAAAVGAECLLAAQGAGTMSDLGDDAGNVVFDLYQDSVGSVGERWDCVPEGFAQEVFDPDDLGCSEVVSSPGTVGLVCCGTRDRVLQRVAGLMEVNGWRTADDASVLCRTFVKSQGTYRWAYITCSEISGTVSITVSVPDAPASEGTV